MSYIHGETETGYDRDGIKQRQNETETGHSDYRKGRGWGTHTYKNIQTGAHTLQEAALQLEVKAFT